LKLIQEWGEWRIKENGGRDEFKYDISGNIVRTLVIATMYPHPVQQK
jgi:hypothetical protein